MPVHVTELTANVDLQFSDQKLHDEVSDLYAGMWEVHCMVTLADSPTTPGYVTTDGIVPQRGCRDNGIDIGQTDDEIVRSSSLTKINITSIIWQICFH